MATGFYVLDNINDENSDKDNIITDIDFLVNAIDNIKGNKGINDKEYNDIMGKLTSIRGNVENNSRVNTLTDNNIQGIREQINDYFMIVGHLNECKDIIDEQIDSNPDINQSQKRMIEINKFENSRDLSSIYIFKILSVGFLVILLALHLGGFLTWLKYIIIVVTLFFMLLHIYREVIYKKSNMDWNKIKWDDNQKGSKNTM